MAVNIEIKARTDQPERKRLLAAAVSGTPGQRIEQTDTYFQAPHGRLKLREINGRAELIYYERENQDKPKPSNYLLAPTAQPADLKILLESAFGIRGVVSKTRTLFLFDDIRIHLDEVAGLGWFVELEVIISPRRSTEQGRAIAEQLMRQLEIDAQDLLAESYVDLLTQGSVRP